MREFVFEVAITAVVRVRAETEALARQAVNSSALGSPSADEIRLGNQANFIEGKEGTITEVDFSIVDHSIKLRDVDEGSSSSPDRFSSIEFPLKWRLNANRERDDLPRQFGNLYLPLSVSECTLLIKANRQMPRVTSCRARHVPESLGQTPTVILGERGRPGHVLGRDRRIFRPNRGRSGKQAALITAARHRQDRRQGRHRRNCKPLTSTVAASKGG
jgi:hypothetical protein